MAQPRKTTVEGTITRFLIALLLLGPSWWIAVELLRERAPFWLGVFLAAFYFPLTLACMLMIPKPGFAFTLLLASLIGMDVFVDWWIPYQPRLLFAPWQVFRAMAVCAAAAAAINVENPTPRMRGLLGFVQFLGACLVLAVAGCIVRVVSDGTHDETHAAEGALVLGFALDDHGNPQPSMIARVDHAVDLYRRGLIHWMAMSGGVVNGEVAEAVVMKRLAMERGVPAEAIFTEEHSHSTRENFQFSATILESHEVRDVLLVTEPYHMVRALLLARITGLDLRPSPAPSPVWSNPRTATYWVFRDSLLLLAQYVLLPIEKTDRWART
jgi:vancomycin permeability regulator SanA